MKYLLNLTFILILFVFALACKNEVPAEDKTEMILGTADSLRYTIERLLRVEDNCTGDTCARIEINYVSLEATEEDSAAQNINQLILDDLRGKEYTNVVAYANGFLREYAQDKKDIPDMSPWNAESNQKVLTNTSKVLCIKTTFYNFTGGAHGLYGTVYNNYQPKTGKKITLEQLIAPNVMEEFLEIAEEFFRKDMAIASQEDLGEAGYDFRNDQFYVPNNFGLLPDGVVFTYGLYEIASYVQGEQEFSIPYNVLEELMQEGIIH
ncbi:MAG: DUF3298 and DUF4163 domain-containing protein [Bacteroidota bacterium]